MRLGVMGLRATARRSRRRPSSCLAEEDHAEVIVKRRRPVILAQCFADQLHCDGLNFPADVQNAEEMQSIAWRNRPRLSAGRAVPLPSSRPDGRQGGGKQPLCPEDSGLHVQCYPVSAGGAGLSGLAISNQQIGRQYVFVPRHRGKPWCDTISTAENQQPPRLRLDRQPKMRKLGLTAQGDVV